MEIKVPVFEQNALQAKGFFYVGGQKKGSAGRSHLCGQMFVEIYVPKEIRHPYPLIFFHGAGQTNVNWLGTPDGRMGWADFFVSQGYVVYLAEQPARGRSAYHADENGPRIFHPMENIELRFTSNAGSWPQSKLHTQWPESGREIGTEIFHQFSASQVEYLPDNKTSQQMVLEVAGELLEKTGPAILLTHSQAGPFGWNIGDAYPESVKGIVSLEPSGPPFSANLDKKLAVNFGISDLPLHFEPEIKRPEEFELTLYVPENENQTAGWILRDDCLLRLPRLSGIPILMLTGEASYHAGYDHLTSRVMNQLGVPHDFIPLETVGIHGNGHMMMLEKNNLEIASWICQWLQNNIN